MDAHKKGQVTLNWEDLKYVLAISRQGSVRAAAASLGVNHTTVSRRINQFELAAGRRLFERTANGYVSTKFGDEVLTEAAYFEERLSGIERKIAGEDFHLSGEIGVTMPEMLGAHLLMPAIAQFCLENPNIEIHVIDSARKLNLNNREADVAFRIDSNPPEYLIGRKLAVMHRACYIKRELVEMAKDPTWLAKQTWIGWSDKERRPVGKIAKEYPKLASKHKIASGDMRMQACQSGLGVAIMPCFIADKEPSICRIPPYTTEGKYDLWVLSHPDLRKNPKIQKFVRFMTDFVIENRALIEGECKEFATN